MNCSGQPYALSVDADNVTIDLNGHSINGDGTTGGNTNVIGIYVTVNMFGGTANNAVVKNGTITKWNSGVFLEDVFNARVQNMNIHDNIGPDATDTFGEGIQIFQGGTHTITGNQVVHNGPFSGINVYGPTNNNTVSSNSVRDNNILGEDHGGAGPTMQDIGIWLVNLSSAGTTSNNTVTANSVTGNGLDGVQVANITNGNFVTSNQVVSNGFGQPPGNPFRDGSGIAVFGNSNTVRNNSAVSNGAAGIGVLFPPNGNPTNGKSNTITLNRALLNGLATTPSTPFDLYDANTTPTPCDSNVWLLNIFLTRNQTCIH